MPSALRFPLILLVLIIPGSWLASCGPVNVNLPRGSLSVAAEAALTSASEAGTDARPTGTQASPTGQADTPPAPAPLSSAPLGLSPGGAVGSGDLTGPGR